MSDFATVQDIESLKRTLTTEEKAQATSLLPIVSDILRAEAAKVDKDLDAIIIAKPYMANVAKSVTVDVVMREIMTRKDREPVQQMSESALGYSVSYTTPNPGDGIYIKKSELSRLGLKRQRLGTIQMYNYGDD